MHWAINLSVSNVAMATAATAAAVAILLNLLGRRISVALFAGRLIRAVEITELSELNCLAGRYHHHHH